jgi:signal peptidase I
MLPTAHTSSAVLPRCKHVTGQCSEEQLYGRRYLIEHESDPHTVAPSVRVVVSPGAVFVMGDRRDNSLDSRIEGTVPLERLIGTALFVWWSVSPSDVGWGMSAL